MITVRIGRKAQMPKDLYKFLGENVYNSFSNECFEANSDEELQNVIARFDNIHNWRGAVTGQWVGCLGISLLLSCPCGQIREVTFNTELLGTGQYYMNNQFEKSSNDQYYNKQISPTSAPNYAANGSNRSTYYELPVVNTNPPVNYYSANGKQQKSISKPTTSSDSNNSNVNVRTVIPVNDTPVEVIAYQVVES